MPEKNMGSGEARTVRLRVVSTLTDPQGEAHVTRNARHGVLTRQPEGLVLAYDDEQEGERAHVVLTMQEKRVTMRRQGMMSGTLHFEPCVRSAGSYVTMYGEIPVAVDTRRVTLDEGEKGGELLLDYDVYIAGERTSSAVMAVTWRW